MANTDPSWDHLWSVFQQAATASPHNYNRGVEDPAPIEDMLGSSPLVDYLRQRLPNKLGETKAGQWLGEQLPQGRPEGSKTERLRQVIENIPLGGYSPDRVEAYGAARDSNPALERYTVEVGRVPNASRTGEVLTGDSSRLAAAQGAGVALNDIATDGLRNIWWFLNAPQALASLSVLHAIHGAGAEFKPAGSKAGLIKSRGYRLAATLPAVIGMSLAVGNAYRQPGYEAAVPSELDPRSSADPLAELGSRYFLGRTGGLLPYDEFVKERPDVSRGEYEQYKAFLHGNKLPIKATLEGINGPEVNFMGKSIPLMTGILPAAAAVIGARMGIRKAGARLQERGLFAKEEELESAWRAEQARARDDMRAPDREVFHRYANQQDANQSELLRQTLLYSGVGLGGTALVGGALESLARAVKGHAPQEEPPAVNTLPAAAPLKP